MKRWLHSDIGLLVRRIGVLYLALGICRVVFYVYNRDIVGPLTWNELISLKLGALQFDTVSILYINLLYIALALLPFRFREMKGYRGALFGYYMVVNTAAVMINLADAVYFHYALKRFTAEELFFFRNDNSLQLIAKFSAENWYMYVIAALIAVGMWKAYGRRITPRTPISNRVIYFTVNTIIFAGIIYLCFGGIRGGFTRMTRPITLSNASQYSPSPTKANLILSNPFCMLRTLGNKSLSYKKYFETEELGIIFSPYHYPPLPNADQPPQPRFASLAGRNVVVFVLESFSAEHSALLNPDLYPDGKGFTPFLDSLMKSGYMFPDAHSNGRKSIEALPSILSSIPSFKTSFVLLPQALGPTHPLPAILAEEGYQTMFFCGSERGSMGFGAYATSAGITTIFGREDYEKVFGKKDFDGYWGIWDEPFLQYMGHELDAKTQPFFSSVFTLSSHHPFVVPAQYADSLPAGHTKIHKGVAYTDMAIRRFFDKYSQKDWFRNTVFLFSADHVSSETFAPKTKTPTGNTHIISFIYTPDGAVRGIHPGVSQQIDLMPTLLGLMRYGKPYFAFGRDLSSTPPPDHMAINYMNQTFQGISDSLVVFFDESKVKAVFERTDTLQRTDISALPNPGIPLIENKMKAFIQQYYTHLEQKSYIVPSNRR